MDLKDRLEAAKARKAAAEAALTEDDRNEIAVRAEVSKIENEALDAERTKRSVELDRRLDAAREAMPGAKLDRLTVQEFPDAFVICYKPKSHARFVDALRRSQIGGHGKTADFDTARLQYALEVVVDWNGRADYAGQDSERTNTLRAYLIENPGILSPITDLAATMAGIVAEERKSGS
jgi:hypothetical protein